MTNKTDKYAALAPRIEYLSDVVVLSQAWKKTHTYIRHHNWYADTLELDCSAVNLDGELSQWSAELRDGTYTPKAARLVPAPKSDPWVFGDAEINGWAPVSSSEHFLRPLAHVGIREQTIATAAMLCLADCVESAQGDTSLDALDAQKAGVFSYGNRLFCSWTDQGARARFSWGNSNVYSRYFQDYQSFVERPLLIAQSAVLSGQDALTLFVIKLDLSAFYDNINIEGLVEKLTELYWRYSETIAPTAKTSSARFWATLAKSLSIGWQVEDAKWAPYLKGQKLPSGLPQGLVSSGFFANAYLVDFDEAVGESIGRSFNRRGVKFRLHDYCRYVDDVRLVVSCDKQVPSEEELGLALTEWVQARLDSKANDVEFEERLVVNEQKTEVQPFASLGGESGTAARMKSLQSQLSGPFDIAALQHVEAGLNGLLAQAELGTAAKQKVDGGRNLPPLASVVRPKREVRDDTLTRFAAYRLTKALKLRRKMTDLTQDEEAGLSRNILLHDLEVAARRLVAAWSLNPGLAQVLTYALDLFPCPELLKTITDALLTKVLGTQEDAYSTGTALYTLAQLFRAGASQTGKYWESDGSLQVGDVERYRLELGQLARMLIDEGVLPWYVRQQALLLLASLSQVITLDTSFDELPYHRSLHEFIGKRVDEGLPHIEETIAVSLVGHQLLRDDAHYAMWFAALSRQSTRKDRLIALELLAQNQPHLLRVIAASRSNRQLAAEPAFQSIVRYFSSFKEPEDECALVDGEWLSFGDIVKMRDTPFHEENALLQLAFALADAVSRTDELPEQWTPQTIQVRCEDWALLSDPRGMPRLSIRIGPTRGRRDPRYRTPEWCNSEDAILYAIGRVIRCAATGELDFTARQWLLREENIGWYRGISSTWKKRQIGMLNTSVAMAGTTAAITPWFSELLLRLLRWPGLQAQLETSSSVGVVTDAAMLRDLVHERLKAQAALFGKSSNLPIYVYPVDWPIDESRLLRVCVIQGLLPTTKDFDGGLASLHKEGFRARQRNHTASILYLAYQQLQARDSVLGKDHKPYVDLVVLPEYSIHLDDQDLMRAFSDATGAMIFYGLCGATHPVTSEPINAARWLVPQRRNGGRSWVEVDQGKKYPTTEEETLGVKPWRPHQVVIELSSGGAGKFRISGAICYDATDISLPADLRDVSHMFIVSAMNKDVKTFDSMVGMLRYHMYQHILVANAGEFGGSTAQAPYEQEHKRLISHNHGSDQISVSVFDVDINHFGPNLQATKVTLDPSGKKKRIGKTPPAGLMRDSVQ